GTGPGSATITITTTDGTFSSSTSFTIARGATIGTQVGLVPHQTLLASSGAVTLNFASEMNNYTTGVASSPPGIATVAPVLDQNRIHSISVTPTTTAGVATVTVTLTGPSGVTSKTSFVVTTAGGT